MFLSDYYYFCLSSFSRFIVHCAVAEIAANVQAAWRRRGYDTVHAGQFMQATNVHFPTSLSAALHPRLCQTAGCTLAFTFIRQIEIIICLLSQVCHRHRLLLNARLGHLFLLIFAPV